MKTKLFLRIGINLTALAVILGTMNFVRHNTVFAWSWVFIGIISASLAFAYLPECSGLSKKIYFLWVGFFICFGVSVTLILMPYIAPMLAVSCSGFFFSASVALGLLAYRETVFIQSKE